MSFYEHIKKYAENEYISFHTPGHKGRNEYLNTLLQSSLDVTELDETDNLFSPSGIIKKSQEDFCKFLNAKAVYYLVNGATSGIMSILSTFNKDDKIIVDRNCHISVINGMLNASLVPVFIEPDFDDDFSIPLPPATEQIKKVLEKNSDAKAVFLTSPNYYGLMCDLKEIRKLTDLKIIVDEAHGTHLYFSDIEKTALFNDCDISILSMHKTLTALTQCGVLAMNCKSNVKQELKKFTSTSPSYLLMMSIDSSFRYMTGEGQKKLLQIEAKCDKLKLELSKIDTIKILDEKYTCDKTRLIINISKYNYLDFLKLLKENYKIVPEFCDNKNIVFIISLHNEEKELQMLLKAIKEITAKLKMTIKENNINYKLPKLELSPYKVLLKESEEVFKNNAVGRICAECIINFPPSVPIVSYGEVIEEEMLEFINKEKIKVIKKL